jgi:hypothetical protein
MQKDLDVEWDPGLGEAARASVMRQRAVGRTDEWMIRLDAETAEEPFLLKPFISASGPTHWFAPPGAGKSIVALALGFCVATGHTIFGSTPRIVGPVLYVDFEDTPEVHQVRLDAICKAYGYEGNPPIMHVKLRGSFRKHARYIRRLARKVGAVLVIIDSVGKAKTFGNNDTESTIQLFNDIDKLGVPTIAVDHVTKEINEKIKQGRVHAESVTAIGSQFSGAAARLGWFMQEIGASRPREKRFNLHNSKHSHVAQQEARSMVVRIESNERDLPTSITFEIHDKLYLSEKKEESTLVQLARAIHRHGDAVTYKDVTQLTGIVRGTASGILPNHDWFEKVSKSGQEARFWLSAEGSAAAQLLEVSTDVST